MTVQHSYTSSPPMGRTACTEPQCLYNGALYLFYLYEFSTDCMLKQKNRFVSISAYTRPELTEGLKTIYQINMFVSYLTSRYITTVFGASSLTVRTRCCYDVQYVSLLRHGAAGNVLSYACHERW